MMEHVHTADIAFTAEDAIAASETLHGTGVAILGGDVIYKTRTGYEFARANWDSKPKPGETVEAYVDRSIQETRDYILRYPASPDKISLFSLAVAQVF